MKIKEHTASLNICSNTKEVSEIWLNLDEMESKSAERYRSTAVISPVYAILRDLHLSCEDRIALDFFNSYKEDGFT